jgi:hypothetical protein
MNCSWWWSVFGSPRSYKREATVSSSSVHHSSPQGSEEFSPLKEQKTRLLFVCNRFVKWIVVARPRKGQIKLSVKQAFHELLVTLPGNTRQYNKLGCCVLKFNTESYLRVSYLKFLIPKCTKLQFYSLFVLALKLRSLLHGKNCIEGAWEYTN